MNLFVYFSFYFSKLVDTIKQFNNFSIKVLNEYGGFTYE
jgi:hypothetical protein